MEDSKRDIVVLDMRVSMGHLQSQDSLGFLCWLTALILAAESWEGLYQVDPAYLNTTVSKQLKT